MKILKNILLAVAIIVAIAAIGIYFLPDHYNVSSSINISKPAHLVYAEVADFNQWKAWSPYDELEPTAGHTFEGTSFSRGHKMTWNGTKLGEGSMTISSTTQDKSIESDLVFLKPFKNTAKDYWEFEETDNTTKVTWGTQGGLSYPFGRLFGLTIDKMLGKTQKHGLENLRNSCEAMQDAPITDSTTVVIK